MLQRLMGTDLPPDIRNEASHEIPTQSLDASLARRELGWTPSHSMEGGLLETIAWYRKHLGDAHRLTEEVLCPT